jgi:hypothetical protein
VADEPTATAEAVAEAPDADRWSRRELAAFLDLFALSGIAIAQPVLDVTGRSPDFFLFNGAGRGVVLLLAVAVTFLPALGLWAGGAVVRLLHAGAGRAVHVATVAGLLAVIAVEVGKKTTPLRGKALLAVAALAALAVTAGYLRLRPVKVWLRYLSPAPLVFLLVFLLVSPTSALVLPGRDSSAGSGTAVRRPVPVVLISFDEFPLASLLDRQGRVDARLYPNFAKLAGASTWYRNATGVSGWTPWAMPAMLTGRWPAKVRAPIWTQYPDNLFTMLGDTYEVRAQETISLLCPPKECRGAATTAAGKPRNPLRAVLTDSARVLRGIASPHDDTRDPTAAFRDQTVSEQGGAGAASNDAKLPATFRFGQLGLNQPARFQAFIDSLEASDRPTLHFLHLLMPHAPWRYLPSGAQYRYPGGNFGINGGPWSREPWPSTLAHQRHLLQLAYTDRLVGGVIEKMKAQGLWDKALFVVTADHGISYMPGQRPRKFDGPNAAELLWVPLFVKLPGQQQGRVDDRNWQHVDLLPTIADVLGVKVPWRVDGVSGLGRDLRTQTQKRFYDVPGRPIGVDGPPQFSRVVHGGIGVLGRPEHGAAGLFELGPVADLVSKPVAGLQRAPAGGLHAQVDGLDLFGHVDRQHGKVPALVWGQLAGASGNPVVAVAVNGMIGGGGPTFVDRSTPDRFAVLVPDRLFRQGQNRVELFTVDGHGPTARLHPVSLTGT